MITAQRRSGRYVPHPFGLLPINAFLMVGTATFEIKTAWSHASLEILVAVFCIPSLVAVRLLNRRFGNLQASDRIIFFFDNLWPLARKNDAFYCEAVSMNSVLKL